MELNLIDCIEVHKKKKESGGELHVPLPLVLAEQDKRGMLASAQDQGHAVCAPLRGSMKVVEHQNPHKT